MVRDADKVGRIMRKAQFHYHAHFAIDAPACGVSISTIPSSIFFSLGTIDDGVEVTKNVHITSAGRSTNTCHEADHEPS